MLGARVNMDIARPQAQGLEDDRVHQANRRRIFRAAKQLFQAFVGRILIANALYTLIGIAATDHRGHVVESLILLAEPGPEPSLPLVHLTDPRSDRVAR